MPRFDLARWGLCGVGLWLLVAPLIFRTPDAGAYASDTLVGSAVIVFSVLVPMMPSRAHHELMMTPGPNTPPGWSYNPSGWVQRGPIIAMAFVGMFLSRYLAAYRLGHIGYPWDPFFLDGTRRVLDSEISRAWPVSDAGLGAVSYTVEALSGLMGGRNRWRTMPWMVVMFAVLVVPLGIVSIVLVVLQPVAVGAWCTLCLATAVAMLSMISPAIDEVVAMCQFLSGARREGKPFWRTFWVGGTLDSYQTNDGSGAIARPRRRSMAAQILGAMELRHVPWNLALSAILGVWLMAAPARIGVTGRRADSDYVAGALVITWAVIAFGEIARPGAVSERRDGLLDSRRTVAALGTQCRDAVARRPVGLVLIALSIRRGRIEERFGSWNRYIV